MNAPLLSIFLQDIGYTSELLEFLHITTRWMDPFQLFVNKSSNNGFAFEHFISHGSVATLAALECICLS